MFRDREDAAQQLALLLRGRLLRDPLVLGIPRGGVVVAATLARELDTEFDVILARKLRTPDAPELAMGAIGEDGTLYANDSVRSQVDTPSFERECQHQRSEIARRQKLFRAVRPAAALTGRSVIVTDDGIATGSTMIAALKVARRQSPKELLVVVPVASPDRVLEVERYCDEVLCLCAPEWFRGVGQFYEDFGEVGDEEVLALLREARMQSEPRQPPVGGPVRPPCCGFSG